MHDKLLESINQAQIHLYFIDNNSVTIVKMCIRMKDYVQDCGAPFEIS